MKWISLIGLLICGSVNAQSVICERYGALPGEPQQTFNRRCPAGYREVGQVGSSSRSGGLANTAQPLVDAITRNNQRTTEALTQSINRSRTQAVSSGQSRQQAAYAAYISALMFTMSSEVITPPQWRLFLETAGDISSTFRTTLIAFDSEMGGRLGGEIKTGKSWSELVDDLPADQQVALFLTTTLMLQRIHSADYGKFGLGTEKGRYISVTSVTPRSPMERAGLAIGDQIISIAIGNQAVKSTRNMTSAEFGGILQSSGDQEVRLQIIPEGSRDVDSAKTIRAFRERWDLNTGEYLGSTDSASATRPPVNPEASQRGNSLVNGLNDLNTLHSQGILTDEEFNAAKRRLLGL